MPVPLAEMEALVGWTFPGGTYTIEHWENFLLYDVTEADPPADDVGHPLCAFHAPLAGMGMSYAEFFDVCKAESDDAIRAGGYDFIFHQPLREGVTYTVRGEITDVERKHGKRAGLFDLVTFRLDMLDGDEPALTAINSWIFLRTDHA